MKYFTTGGPLYGLIYTLWRGWGRGADILSTQLYRRCIGSCGAETHFGHPMLVLYPRQVQIGKGGRIGRDVSLLSETAAARLLIGDDVQINDGVAIDFTGNVSIADRCLLSAGAMLMSHDHGYDPHATPVERELVIERGVWVGEEALILPGVQRIGRDAIIGARAVVTKPVPAGAIVAGNPARVIKMRDDLPSQEATG